MTSTLRSIAAAFAFMPTFAVGADAACRTSEGTPRFEMAEGVAFDRASGLEWRRCALGARFADGRCEGEALAVGLDRAEAEIARLGEGWRLPSVKELSELLDERCDDPPIDPALFPDLAVGADGEGATWTSTPVGMAELWYFVDLGRGFADGHSRSYSLTVRLVRARAR